MKYYEYEKDELEVGMEVAVPTYINFGWNQVFRYPIWKKETIAKLTPKKTKITLDSGRTLTADRRGYGYSTGVYKYDGDEGMVAETFTAKRFLYTLKNRDIITRAGIEKLSDNAIAVIAEKISDIKAVLEKEKANGEN